MLRHKPIGDFDVVTGPPAPLRRAVPAAEPASATAPAAPPIPNSGPAAAGRLEKPAA